MLRVSNVKSSTVAPHPVPAAGAASFNRVLDDAGMKSAGSVRALPNDPHLAAPAQTAGSAQTAQASGNMTTQAVGEEGGPDVTTMAIGEECRGDL